MGILPYVGLFIISLAVLLFASDKFVESAERIGLAIGISPFVIGVTIIAFGTSLPELATSIASIYSGSSEVVIGNVIGSNITNIFLVLGFTAIIGKMIRLDYNVMDIDLPLLFGSAFLLYFVLEDYSISYFETILFLGGLIIFLINSFKGNKTHYSERPRMKKTDLTILIIAGIFVYYGASYTIVALEEIAEAASISPHIIAITVIALGTSLPELIVSMAAARKGKHAMAVGNVLGSNVFNIFAVLGISRLFGDITIPEIVMSFDIRLMIVATILFGIMCLAGRMTRWEGALLVFFYIYFIGHSIKQVIA